MARAFRASRACAKVGDFESAIVTEIGVMPEVNPKDYEFVVGLVGKDRVTKMNYIPTTTRCASAAGRSSRPTTTACTPRRSWWRATPSDDIAMDWLLHGIKRREPKAE